MGSQPLASSLGTGWLTALFDLSRGRQAMLSVAQPALGTVIALGGLPPARVVVLGLVAAGAGYLAVFSLNDYLDRRADSEAAYAGGTTASGYDVDVAYVRHPLARGDLSATAARTWIGSLALLSVAAAWLLSPVCLWFFALAVVLEIGYCSLRSVTWTKTFVSGLMVGVGGLAGWVAVAPVDDRTVSYFMFLALWEIAGRNLPNDLADLDLDRPTDIKTVATVFGPRASALSALAGSLLTLGALVLLPLPVIPRIVGGALGAATMVLPAVALAFRPTPDSAASYFNRASTLPAWVFLVAVLTLAVGR